MGGCNSSGSKGQTDPLCYRSSQDGSSVADAREVVLHPHRGGDIRGAAQLLASRERNAGPRQCPKLTIYTEVDDEEHDKAGLIVTPGTEVSKYAMTPIVALAPFAERGSRMLTASMFQKRYGKPEVTEESQKAGDSRNGNVAPKEMTMNGMGTFAPSTEAMATSAKTTTTTTTTTIPVEDGDTRVGSADKTKVSPAFSSHNGSPDEGTGKPNRPCSPEEKEAVAEEQESRMDERDDKGPHDAEDKVVALNNAKSDRKRFFTFCRCELKKNGGSSSNIRELLGSDQKKRREKENGGGHSKASSKGKSDAVATRTLSREQIILVGWQRLQRRLDELKLAEHRVKDDGNCQFRAFAQQLLGSEEYHELVRVHIVTYMKSVRGRFDCYFASKEEADCYYRDMLKNGTWGDELTLRAASDSLFINIHVLSSEQQNFYIAYRPSADAPPPPAFLVDVATLRKQRQQHTGDASRTSLVQPPLLQAIANANATSTTLTTTAATTTTTTSSSSSSSSSTSNSSSNSTSGISNEAASAKTPGTVPVLSAPSLEAAGTDTKAADEVEDDGHDLVDACALQRHLQRKLAASTMRTASTPVLDMSAFSSFLIQRTGTLRQAASDSPLAAVTGDVLCKNAPCGWLDVSLATGSGSLSPASSSEHPLHLRSVSEEVAKFLAMGAERMDKMDGQHITVFIPNSTCAVNNMAGVQCKQREEQWQQQQQEKLLSDTSMSLAPTLPTNRGFILFSPETGASGGGAAVILGGDQSRLQTHTPDISFDAEAKSSSPTSTSYLPVEEDQNINFLFEGHTEPIDVFLSYLSPLHYNALSLAVERPSSSTEKQQQQQQQQMSSGGQGVHIIDREASLPSMKKAVLEGKVLQKMKSADGDGCPLES